MFLMFQLHVSLSFAKKVWIVIIPLTCFETNLKIIFSKQKNFDDVRKIIKREHQQRDVMLNCYSSRRPQIYQGSIKLINNVGKMLRVMSLLALVCSPQKLKQLSPNKNNPHFFTLKQQWFSGVKYCNYTRKLGEVTVFYAVMLIIESTSSTWGIWRTRFLLFQT